MEIPLSSMRYDHTMPLLDGRVTIEGVDLKPVRTNAMVFSDVSELRKGDFGLWDLNIGYVLPAVEAGWELIGLPVFVKRKGLYTFLWCRSDRGIETPKDLEGKRIGSGSYPTAITTWLQGFLQHRYGVDIARVEWVVSNANRVFPLHRPTPRVQAAPDQKSPVDRLIDGEVDAIITDISDGKAFERLEGNPLVKRLFADYVGWDKKLFRESGIYPPVHQIVMSKRLDRESPGLALRLYEAFDRAKALAYEDIANDRAGFSVIYLRERFIEQQREWGDPWAYGIERNASAIDAFIQYNVDQGITSQPIPKEAWFAAGALGT